MRRALVIATLLALTTAGCMGRESNGPGGGGARSQGAIEATVWLVGGPAPGRRRMKGAAIDVLAGGHPVARVRTDSRGRFRLATAPGRYRFRLKGGPELVPLTGALVTAAQTTRLHLILSAK